MPLPAVLWLVQKLSRREAASGRQLGADHKRKHRKLGADQVGRWCGDPRRVPRLRRFHLDRPVALRPVGQRLGRRSLCWPGLCRREWGQHHLTEAVKDPLPCLVSDWILLTYLRIFLPCDGLQRRDSHECMSNQSQSLRIICTRSLGSVLPAHTFAISKGPTRCSKSTTALAYVHARVTGPRPTTHHTHSCRSCRPHAACSALLCYISSSFSSFLDPCRTSLEACSRLGLPASHS
jgi:hypothetical protein